MISILREKQAQFLQQIKHNACFLCKKKFLYIIYSEYLRHIAFLPEGLE